MKQGYATFHEFKFPPLKFWKNSLQLNLYFGSDGVNVDYCVGFRCIYESESCGESVHMRGSEFQRLNDWLSREPKDAAFEFMNVRWNEIGVLNNYGNDGEFSVTFKNYGKDSSVPMEYSSGVRLSNDFAERISNLSKLINEYLELNVFDRALKHFQHEIDYNLKMETYWDT